MSARTCSRTITRRVSCHNIGSPRRARFSPGSCRKRPAPIASRGRHCGLHRRRMNSQSNDPSSSAGRRARGNRRGRRHRLHPSASQRGRHSPAHRALLGHRQSWRRCDGFAMADIQVSQAMDRGGLHTGWRGDHCRCWTSHSAHRICAVNLRRRCYDRLLQRRDGADQRSPHFRRRLEGWQIL